MQGPADSETPQANTHLPAASPERITGHPLAPKTAPFPLVSGTLLKGKCPRKGAWTKADANGERYQILWALGPWSWLITERREGVCLIPVGFAHPPSWIKLPQTSELPCSWAGMSWHDIWAAMLVASSLWNRFPRNGVARLRFIWIFNFNRCWQIAFLKGCNNSHFHPQCMREPFFLNTLGQQLSPYQALGDKVLYHSNFNLHVLDCRWISIQVLAIWSCCCRHHFFI